MYTYMKIGEVYYHVFIHISDNVMSLRSSQGLRQDVKMTLDLEKIEDLYVIELLGSRQITFTYDDEDFRIYQQGLAVVDYLERELCEKVRR